MHDLVYFYPEGHQAHAELGHPERPERVETIRLALEAVGWWQAYPRLEPQLPGEELLAEIHDRGYLTNLQAASSRGQRLDADTYTTPASWQLALNSAGGALAVTQAVWSRDAKRGFAMTRPPGHHATAQRGMGFCLLNNVALASEYLIREYDAERLAIIDLDLHHGNGTQDIFWKSWGCLVHIYTPIAALPRYGEPKRNRRRRGQHDNSELAPAARFGRYRFPGGDEYSDPSNFGSIHA